MSNGHGEHHQPAPCPVFSRLSPRSLPSQLTTTPQPSDNLSLRTPKSESLRHRVGINLTFIHWIILGAVDPPSCMDV